MAIKYRISESGIQKVIEVVNGSTVIGKSKYGPKELSIVNNSGTVQIKDSLNDKVLYSGSPSSFVNSNDEVFGQTAQAVVSAITALSDNIKINIAELDGLELVEDQLLPDLSEYAKTSEVQSSLSVIEEVIDNNIEKHLAHTRNIVTWNTQDDTTLSYRDISVTFTVPANGRVQIKLPLQIELTQAGTFYGYINRADPGENGQVFEGDDDINQFTAYLSSIGHPSAGTGSLDSMGVRVTMCRIPIPDPLNFPMNLANIVTQEISGLTPGAEETIYLWLSAGAVHFNCEAAFTFVDGIKVLEVED